MDTDYHHPWLVILFQSCSITNLLISMPLLQEVTLKCYRTIETANLWKVVSKDETTVWPPFYPKMC